MIKRFDTLEVTTTDLDDAAAIYQGNFDFHVQKHGDEATIEVGDARIRLRSVVTGADSEMNAGEGLAAIWLETDDLDSLANKMKEAKLKVSEIRVQGNRRILTVDPASANMVPLYIFQRL